MRDPNRIGPVLMEIERLWRKQPDLRLGQLILNIVKGEFSPEVSELYNLEDAEIIKRLRKAYEREI